MGTLKNAFSAAADQAFGPALPYPDGPAPDPMSDDMVEVPGPYGQPVKVLRSVAEQVPGFQPPPLAEPPESATVQPNASQPLGPMMPIGTKITTVKAPKTTPEIAGLEEKSATKTTEAAKAEKKAIEAQGETFRAQAVEERKTADLMRAQAAEEQQAQAFQQGEVDYQMARIGDAMAELKEKKFDPDRYWKQRGTGARVAAIIGVALGAVGASLSGGRNTAMDLLNQALERDDHEQEVELQKARDRVGLENNVLAQLTQRGLSLQQARAAKRTMELETVAARLRGVAAEYKGTEIAARAEGVLPQVEAQLAQKKADGLKASQDRVQIETDQSPKFLGKNQQLRPLDATTAEKLANFDASIQALDAGAKKYGDTNFMAFLAKHVPGTDAKNYETARTPLVQTIGYGLEGGKLTDSDRAYYETMIPAADDSAKTGKKKFQELRALAVGKRKTFVDNLRAAGYDVSRLPSEIKFSPDEGE